MNFNAMAAKLRRDLASVPGFTVAQPGESARDVWARVDRRQVNRVRCVCAECGAVIREGGTTQDEVYELCSRCTEPGTDAR